MVSVQTAGRERGRERERERERESGREKAAQYKIKNVAVCLNG